MANQLLAGKEIRIGRANELAEGRGSEIEVEGRRLALFNVKGNYFAISNSCLHRGGPLSQGEVDGYEVTCPWHGWKYDVRTGSFEIIPTLKVKAYRVERRGEDLFIELDH